MAHDNASYSAGYRAGVEFERKHTAAYDAKQLHNNVSGKPETTQTIRRDAYANGYKSGTKYGLEQAGGKDRYSEGYRAGAREVPDREVKATLTRLMDTVNKLGNHSSVLMVKHEIKKELERMNNNELKVEHSMSL